MSTKSITVRSTDSEYVDIHLRIISKNIITYILIEIHYLFSVYSYGYCLLHNTNDCHGYLPLAATGLLTLDLSFAQWYASDLATKSKPKKAPEACRWRRGASRECERASRGSIQS